MKNFKVSLMISVLIAGQGVMGAQNSWTTAIKDGSTEMLYLESFTLPLIFGTYKGAKFIETTWTKNFYPSSGPNVWSALDLAPVRAAVGISLGGAAHVVAGGITAITMPAVVEKKEDVMSRKLNDKVEAGLLAFAANGVCTGGLIASLT